MRIEVAVMTGTAPSAWDDPHDLVTAVDVLNEQKGRR